MIKILLIRIVLKFSTVWEYASKKEIAISMT